MRVEVIDDANVADVNEIDIEADDISNSEDTIDDPDEDDEAGILASPMTTPERMRTPSLKRRMTA